MSDNLLDKAISWVAPGLALKRMRARVAMEFVRSYEGAKTGRRGAGWDARSTSANAEIGPDLIRLRNRSRDLIRNNPYATRACAAWVANVIGTGIVPKLSAGKQVWDRWVRGCDYEGRLDFYGIQSLAERTAFESGECLVRLRWIMTGGLEIPLKLQVMEPDYIDTLRNQALPDGGYVREGIQYDRTGTKVAYWLFPAHPGAVYPLVTNLVSSPVPAEDIIHIHEILRPGQARGVPRLAPVMMKMRDLDDYEEAELLRKGIESCFAAFVETDDESLVAGTAATSDPNAPSGSPRNDESISAGMIKYLRPGEKISFGAPSAVAGTPEFIRLNQRTIAAGLNITYEMMTGDLSQTNYSSMRAGRLEFRRYAEQYQWHTFIPQFCHRIEDAFRRAAIIGGAGRVGKATFSWTPPKWDWVDPMKDAAGVVLELAAGLTSWEEEARKRGWDADELLNQIKQNQEALKAAGITVQWDKLVLGAAAASAQEANINTGVPANA